MEKEKKEKPSGAAEIANSLPMDLTSMFDNNKTKKLMQQNQSVGRVRAQSLTLINTASALFLQGLVQKAASHAAAQPSLTSSNNNDDKPIVINMEAIQSAINAKSEQYGFLQQALLIEEKKGHITLGESLFTPMPKPRNDKRKAAASLGENSKQKAKVANDQKGPAVTATVANSAELKSIADTLDIAAAAAEPEATGNISFHTLQQEIVGDESDYD